MTRHSPGDGSDQLADRIGAANAPRSVGAEGVCCPCRFGSPNPPGRTTTGQPRTGPEEEPWPKLGIAFAPLGVETKAPQPRPGGSRERDHHQRRSTEWGRASFGSRADTERPPHSACGGRPHGRRKTQISRIPHAAVSTPPSSRRLIKQQRCGLPEGLAKRFQPRGGEMTLL